MIPRGGINGAPDMAYLAFDETGGGTVLDGTAVPVADPIAFLFEPPLGQPPEPRLTALEWSVVTLAERDRLGSLRTPGRMAMAMALLFGERTNPQLADPRLEALRRIAVLSWHHGYTVPSVEVRAFQAAGFTPDQYELVVDSIALGRAAASARRFHR